MNSPVFCCRMEMKMLNCLVLSLLLLRHCSPQHQLNVTCRVAAHCPHPAAAVGTKSPSKRDVKTRKRSRQCEWTRKTPEDNIQAEMAKPKRRAASTCHWSQWQWWQEREWGQEVCSSNSDPELFSLLSCRKYFVFHKTQPSPLLDRVCFCTPCSGSGQSWSLLETLSHRGGNTCSWQLLPLWKGTKSLPATSPV